MANLPQEQRKQRLIQSKPSEKGEISPSLSRKGDVLHHIFPNDQNLIVLAEHVNAVVQSDKATAEGRKHKVRVLARFDVITTEAR